MPQTAHHNTVPTRRDGKILLYSNLANSASLIESIRAAVGHYEIQSVVFPAPILPCLLRGGIDLVLLDIDALSGAAIDVVRDLRSHFSSDALPVITLSDTNPIEHHGTAMAVNINDFLIKPLDPAEAKFRIRNALKLSQLFKANLAIRDREQLKLKTRTDKLNLLIDSGLMMSMERNQSKLIGFILREGQRLLHCDGATMYFVTPQKTLVFAERTRNDVLPFDEIPLYDASGRANDGYAATYAAIHNQAVLIDDVYDDIHFDCRGTHDFDARTGYRTVSLLTVPMAPRSGKVIGVLQFINALDPDSGEVIAFPDSAFELVEALAAQAAVALDNLQLVEGQKATTENIIHVLAAALDTKSPHTGHHCVRVPKLAMMLAEAACRETDGPLADFNFHSDDEWLEFRVGAWLHDCGKVTTPESVIDKATKLDMFFNRIHEIRTRFEVLLRDAAIARLEAIVAGEDPAAADARFEQRKSQLEADFAFIADCNLGKEIMADADIERIGAIADQTWLRHFDDSLGLSQAEFARRRSRSTPTLPAREYLLADQDHHRIPRTHYQLPPAKLGIKMTIPEHLHNYGELYNLGIRKGTLTPEERFKINEHIIETIKMLEQMPFPDFLKRVPEYASTHHETLDGRGYPRGLTGDELSIPARIMAIADIFEAITSADRPYKTPYKLSEAVKILHDMKCQGRIDGDLFDLFLNAGIHRSYAEQYLLPDQIDDIDIRQFVGPSLAGR